MNRGDHLYVDDSVGGIPFQHHGIDIGDGTVIHLAPVDAARVTLRDNSHRFMVRRVSLEEFAAGRKVKVKRHTDQRSADEIVAAAESMLGKSGYSLLEGNCEHFATHCATGKSESHQVEMSHATVASMTSAATKAFWSVSARCGTQAFVRGASKVHPAALLADGVELVALTVGCRQGLSHAEARRIAKTSGNLAAVGIGAIVGGPVGAAVGLAAHTTSRAIAERLCERVRRLLS